jgi:uncharacterized protein YbcI
MSGERRTSGEIAAEVSSSIVKLFTSYYGRGPVKAKSFLFDNYVVTVLEDTMTTAEATLVRTGRSNTVREFRLAFQTEMADEFKGTVERATGRAVIAYQSQIVFDPDYCFEFFVLDGPPEIDGADHSL